MNTDQQPDAGASREPLPELSDERINRIETSLFSEIARDRTVHRKRRTGVWVASSAAAAVIVVAAVIAPSVGGLLTGTASNDAAVGPAAPLVDSGTGGESDSSVGVAPDENAVKEGLITSDDAGAADSVSGADVGEPTRDIITTASATIVVGDISAAAAMITDAAVSRDGYVESMSIGQSGQVVPVDPETGMVYDSTMPYPYTPDGAWITVRVPADGLQSLVDQLSGLGEVTASSVNRQDVTAVTLDLEARVDAAQASVDRLTELMAQAGNLSDLIAAESALAERQATLESYEAQLKSLDSLVDMSSLTVTLQPVVEPVEADPAGFADGFVAGWNGLVATLNGIVVALGFLIPWLVVIAIAGLIVWAIVRSVRRRRAARAAAPAPATVATAAPVEAPAPGSGEHTAPSEGGR